MDPMPDKPAEEDSEDRKLSESSVCLQLAVVEGAFGCEWLNLHGIGVDFARSTWSYPSRQMRTLLWRT